MLQLCSFIQNCQERYFQKYKGVITLIFIWFLSLSLLLMKSTLSLKVNRATSSIQEVCKEGALHFTPYFWRSSHFQKGWWPLIERLNTQLTLLKMEPWTFGILVDDLLCLWQGFFKNFMQKSSKLKLQVQNVNLSQTVSLCDMVDVLLWVQFHAAIRRF